MMGQLLVTESGSTTSTNFGASTSASTSTVPASAPAAAPTSTSEPKLHIGKRARTGSSPSLGSGSSEPATKAAELLASHEVIAFLSQADETIKVEERPLPRAEVERLEALGAQASYDNCDVLIDIVEHILDENQRLLSALAQRQFGGSASRPYCVYAARQRQLACA